MEKNIPYLADAVTQFLRATPNARFLIVGDGAAREAFERLSTAGGVADRVILAGRRTGSVLRDAYRAMDVFAFASHTETQGMVVAEAMAAQLPVVALNATGVREVVTADNGVLLPADASPADFAATLRRLAADPGQRRRRAAAAAATARQFSIERSAARLLECYQEARRATRARRLEYDLHPWTALLKRLGLEWDLLSVRTQTLAAAMFGETKDKSTTATAVAAGR